MDCGPHYEYVKQYSAVAKKVLDIIIGKELGF
jgi:hypothetical protein